MPHLNYRCSFCGKGPEQVLRLLSGPDGVYICNECVEFCHEILEQDGKVTRPSGSSLDGT